MYLRSNQFSISVRKRVKKYQVITKPYEIVCCLVLSQIFADHRNIHCPFLSSSFCAYDKCWHAGCPKGIVYHLWKVVNIRLSMYHAIIMTACSETEETSRTGGKRTGLVSTTYICCLLLNMKFTMT